MIVPERVSRPARDEGAHRIPQSEPEQGAEVGPRLGPDQRIIGGERAGGGVLKGGADVEITGEQEGRLVAEQGFGMAGEHGIPGALAGEPRLAARIAIRRIEPAHDHLARLFGGERDLDVARLGGKHSIEARKRRGAQPEGAAGEDGHPVIGFLPHHRHLVAKCRETLARHLILGRLELLEEDEIGRLLAQEALEQARPLADRVDVVGGEPHAQAGAKEEPQPQELAALGLRTRK